MSQDKTKAPAKVGRPRVPEELKKKHITLRLEAQIIEKMKKATNWRAALEDLLRIMYP